MKTRSNPKTPGHLLMSRIIFAVLFGFFPFINYAQTTHPLVAPAANGDFNPCVQLLSDGLRDVYTTANNVSFFSDSKQYFSSDQFVNDYHSGKWNGGISVVIDDVPIGLNAGASDNDIHQFQQKIRQSSSLVVQVQTYTTMTRSTLNVDLANTYTDCVVNSQSFGLSIDLSSSDDNTANVLIKYRPLSSGDTHPKIKSVQLLGLDDNATASLLNSTLKVGTVLPDQLSFTAYRKPKQEFIIVINSDNGLSMIKRSAAPDDSGSGVSPIGTIVASMLDFDSFSKLTKNNSNSSSGVWSPTKSKWAPCDGRAVTGSKYQTLWAGSVGQNAPDLRGVFLRGLNQFDLLEANRVSPEQANPEVKLRGEHQKDQVGPHTHPASLNGAAVPRWGAPGMGMQSDHGQQFSFSLPGVAVGNNPGVETRPKNVSIYYYIRIN